MWCICRQVNSLNTDKSWMSIDKRSIEYENGVNEFLKFAILHASIDKFHTNLHLRIQNPQYRNTISRILKQQMLNKLIKI